MKNLKKVTILRAVVILLMCGLFMTPVTASAAKKKDLKIEYKKKTVTIGKDATFSGLLESMRAAWGEPKNIVEKDGNITSFNYNKGKNQINISCKENDGVQIGILVVDDQFKAHGIKVGMTKTKALKKLKKNLGKKNVKTRSKGTEIVALNTVEGVSFEVEKGKIKNWSTFINIER